MAKRFSSYDGLVARDLVRFGLDHISAGVHLLQQHPFYFDSAGYLIHIGYECLLKGWVLEVKGAFDGTHSIKRLRNQIPELASSNLPPEMNHIIGVIDDYERLRYPNRNEPAEIGTDEMMAIKKLVNLTVQLLPETLIITESQAHATKGGRILMKKKNH